MRKILCVLGKYSHQELELVVNSHPHTNLMHVHVWRVELPDGSYTLVQEGEGAAEAEAELNYTSVQQDLGQSSEEPKAVVEEEEGKPRLH